LLGVVKLRFPQDFPSQNTALSALACNSKRIANVFKRICTVGDGGANLGVGYAFAETDVHASNQPRLADRERLILMRMIVN
jgi:hypothetical protein